MTRALSYAIAASILVLASGSLLAQSRTVPKQFGNVRSLGRAASEFKDDRGGPNRRRCVSVSSGRIRGA